MTPFLISLAICLFGIAAFIFEVKRRTARLVKSGTDVLAAVKEAVIESDLDRISIDATCLIPKSPYFFVFRCILWFLMFAGGALASIVTGIAWAI